MIYRFANAEVDCQTRELRVHGQRVDIEPLVFDLLVCLLENRDRVVGKDELFDTIWPRQVVSEAALTRCVMKARKAVGDVSGSQRIIRTLRGHGYRFIANAQVTSGARASAATQSQATTEYARNDGVSIAYQVLGSGPVDVVLVNGWISNVEMAWEHPRPRYFIERLASFSRLINFDKRGTGLSDRGGALPTFEQRMDDVRSVMDAAGSERAVLLGYSEGGPMSALFAATYPERTLGLVLYGSYMKRVRSLDYPWAPTRDDRLNAIKAAELNWDQGLDVEHYAPSMVGDPEFAEWLMSYWRRSASPRSAAEVLRMNTDIDMRHVLPSIRVPTLVMHRKHDRDSRVEEGRYIANHIPGARFIELPGNDHLIWAGEIDDVVDPAEAFIVGLQNDPPVDSVLVSLVGARLPPGKSRDQGLLSYIQRTIDANKGHCIANTASHVVASFDGTGRALRTALALDEYGLARSLQVSCAVHVGECERSGDTVIGAPVDTVRRVADEANPGEILATQIVRDLVSEFAFEECGRIAYQSDVYALYRVST
jgi:pimeloyl-ACP methyl ester carboxylesterase